MDVDIHTKDSCPDAVPRSLNYTHAHAHACTHILTLTHAHIRTLTHAHIHACTRAHTNMRIHTRAHTCPAAQV